MFYCPMKLRPASIALAIVLAFSTAVFWPQVTGCKSKSVERVAHTTLASIGQAVDIAEREYLDQVVTGRASTNDFRGIQFAYAAFQVAYGTAVGAAAGNTNSLSSSNLTAQGFRLITRINQSKGK